VAPEATEGRRSVLLDSLGDQIYLPRTSRRAALVRKQLDLLQGTLDMLILKAVSLGPLHGPCRSSLTTSRRSVCSSW
jgi:hypothetical protein